jgi:cytosine/adenosine deaminase-related metal-dependent hydrolase
MRPTIYTAAWVLPVAAPPIRSGAVLVGTTGAIEAVAPAHSLRAGDDVARIDLGNAMLLPGLINTHAHPELAAMRGLLENLPFHDWIPTLRRTRSGAALEAADHAAAALWTCAEAVAAGVTTMAATEDSGAALAALREAGMRGIVYREVFGPEPTQAAAALQDLRVRVAAMRDLATDLVRVGVSPHAPYTVSNELFELVADWARAESLPVAVHAAEAEAELKLVTQGAGPFAAGLRTRGIATPPRARSSIELLHATGVLAARPLLIHCVNVDADDIARIADAGATVAHCPVANARLGHGVAPAVAMMERGIAIGLGSDSVAANNRIDMIEEARIAQLMQRARLGSAAALPPDRLLRMLTIDAARALGIDARTGTLEVGKDADLCAVRLDGPHTRPVHDPITTLLLSMRGADVMLTAVRGSVLYRDGRFLTLDLQAHAARLEDAAARLRAARDA